MIGANGSGVSAQPADKALSIDTATAPGGMAIPSGTAVAAAEELTVTGWYKPRTGEMKDAQTLFNCFGSSLLWDGKINEWMWRVSSKGTSNPKATTWYGSGKNPPLFSAGQWTFIAMTWKRAENRADFYMGSSSTAAAFTHKVERNDPVDSAKEGAKRAIGSDPGKPEERAFNGEIDNMRFFTKALDAATIENIRAADAKNEVVTIP